MFRSACAAIVFFVLAAISTQSFAENESVFEYQLPSQSFSWAVTFYSTDAKTNAAAQERLKDARSAQALATARASNSLAQVLGKPVVLSPDCYADMPCFVTLELGDLLASIKGSDFQNYLAAADSDVFLMVPIIQRLDQNVIAAKNAGDPYRVVDAMSERDQFLRSAYAATLGTTPYREETDLVVLWIRTAVRERDLEDANFVLQATEGMSADEQSKFLAHAWILAQHADRTPALQYMTLRAMQAGGSELVKGVELAMMTDRFQITIGEKQIYGTQTACIGGHWQRSPISDPSRLNERRKQVGLQPIDLAKGGDACSF